MKTLNWEPPCCRYDLMYVDCFVYLICGLFRVSWLLLCSRQWKVESPDVLCHRDWHYKLIASAYVGSRGAHWSVLFNIILVSIGRYGKWYHRRSTIMAPGMFYGLWEWNDGRTIPRRGASWWTANINVQKFSVKVNSKQGRSAQSL
jgi:hypothetical protein